MKNKSVHFEFEITPPKSVPSDFIKTSTNGLTEEEAERRLAAGPGNANPTENGKPLSQILAEHIFTLFNLINFVLAACLFAVGSYRNMLFMGVVVCNILTGVIQELRARSVIRRLRLMHAPTVQVVRNGRERSCPTDSLVCGDLIILRAGNQIPADAVVIEGSGAVNEALLSGESTSISKQTGSMLLSGSYVTEGRMTAQLVCVGAESYAARLVREARRVRHPKSALMTDLNRLIRIVTIVLLPFGTLLFLKQLLLLCVPLEEAVSSTAASMIGMIPEGLILLTSVALAVGVIRLGRKNTLVQELFGIEALARVDTLCLDKTGTLTTGQMKMEALIPVESDEIGFRYALSRFLGAFDDGSETLNTLKAMIPPGHEVPTATLPFSSTRKKSAAAFADGNTYVLGAPNYVLENGKYSGELHEKVRKYASDGFRVLLFAEAKGQIIESVLPNITKVIGLCVICDEIRPYIPETVRYFNDQGVELKVISGDDPAAASAIALRCGIAGAENFVDLSGLKSEEELDAACLRYTVFGRATPDQKKRLIEAMKREGRSVGMVGDGVNDIPAMKASDCSIAMAGGSDAAKHAAQIVLLDSDFASMPQIVLEGRRVVNNVSRSASLFLTKTLFSFGLSALFLFLPFPYPFQPIQLTLISALTIGAPSFVLAFQPNRDRIEGSFLRKVMLCAVPAAAAVTVCAALSMLMMRLVGWDSSACSTAATICSGVIGLISLERISRPFNLLRAGLLVAMTAAFAVCVLFFPDIFLLTPLQKSQIPVLLLLLSAGILVFMLISLLMRRLKNVERKSSKS